NESLNLTQYQSIIENIDHDILYIEEPFQSLDDIKRINGKPYPPIALDEKATSNQEIKNIISEYPIEVVILKPFRLGGIDRVLDAIQTLHKEGVKV
ncbi:enolase C-terminal domain-like protein, partial [Staphylococcus epidermidis]